MNIELIDKVIEHFKEHPNSANMNKWFEEKPYSTCGTVGCIAGWVCAVGRQMERHEKGSAVWFTPISKNFTTPEQARQLLDISSVTDLFYADRWPTEFILAACEKYELFKEFQFLNEVKDDYYYIGKIFGELFSYNYLTNERQAEIMCYRLEWLKEKGE
ncbi:hypothetical protein UFOVP434_96 [uncultured Caudovirales phage]|uniref:Uncharacterized protein n=1 Tax=uncultured Caudovirales phage TaxID=2100421 RepID=A0A6J5MAP3_9CAUD|nr:hypothetical protein UFOVP434_96 [uncultured Caudovirales phage]